MRRGYLCVLKVAVRRRFLHASEESDLESLAHKILCSGAGFTAPRGEFPVSHRV